MHNILHMRMISAFVIVLLSSSAVTAHAGMFEFVDKAFTFRKDQKDRVAPRRYLPPKIIETPHFNVRENTEWARTYTRGDLVPVDHLEGSASKVMRPDPRLAQNSANRLPGGGYMKMMSDRQRANQAANTSGRIYVGDAGTGPGMRLYDARIAKKTAVGDPVTSWRDGARSDYASPRNGDYNYREPIQPRGYGVDTPLYGGTVINGTRAQGENRYTVERGDTLSTISEKPQIYGNWKLWPLIHEANRATIGSNPRNIFPKQRLDIPRGAKQPEARRAIKKATQWGLR